MNSTPKCINKKISYQALLSKNVHKYNHITILYIHKFQDEYYSLLYKSKNINNISTMILNKKLSKDKNKNNNSKISKSIQSNTNKKDKNSKYKNKSPNNNVIALKRSSSQINSFISRYENDIRNNKTINLDNKRDYLIKNKFFFFFI